VIGLGIIQVRLVLVVFVAVIAVVGVFRAQLLVCIHCDQSALIYVTDFC
jgi:hypothetical protein